MESLNLSLHLSFILHLSFYIYLHYIYVFTLCIYITFIITYSA